MDRNVTVSARSLLVGGLVALALVAAYLIGRAGPAPASAETTDGTRTVTVTGLGHVSVVPDQLAFDLSVSVLRDDLSAALDDANTSVASVVDNLKAVGVDEKDVQTSDVSMYPEYGRHQKGQPPKLIGYRVTHSLSVTVEDLSKASDVVTAAVGAGGSGVQLNGLRLQIAEPDDSLEPARTDAMAQAQAKAEEYAANAGGELGDIVRISETTDQPYVDNLSYDVRASAASDSAAIPIQAGQQDLTASIVVVYELK